MYLGGSNQNLGLKNLSSLISGCRSDQAFEDALSGDFDDDDDFNLDNFLGTLGIGPSK